MNWLGVIPPSFLYSPSGITSPQEVCVMKDSNSDTTPLVKPDSLSFEQNPENISKLKCFVRKFTGSALEYNLTTGKWILHWRAPWHLFISNLWGHLTSLKMWTTQINHPTKLCWLDKIASMFADTSDCCSLELAKRNWVSDDNECSSSSKPRVEFRSTRPRVKCLQTKRLRRGCDGS